MRISCVASDAKITVWDGGPGIPPSEFDKVFIRDLIMRGTIEEMLRADA